MAENKIWWQRGVVYQIYPRSFQDSNDDGIGDVPGIIARLDDLHWLGVDVLWVSPIFQSPMADFGYDVSDYCDIHPMFGTLEDVERLIDEAHRRNMRVLFDLVANHTSDQHPWFVAAQSGRDNPKRDWYIWRDPAPDGGPPNNWMSYFGGPAWTLDAASGQYYLHNFLPQQPELNWRNPEVAQAMFKVVRFWLDRGLDGFRIDVVDRIAKDPQFRDNPPNPNWREGDDPTTRYRRLYSEAHHPDVLAHFRALRGLFDSYDGDRVAIGEVAYKIEMDTLVGYYGARGSDGTTGTGLHLPYNFGLMMVPWEAAAIKGFVDAYEAALPDYAWPNYVLGNHDNPRIASRIGVQQARVAAMLLLTLRGTPTLYYGDEIGMENVSIPRERIQDPQGRNTSLFNRDEARTPMQWEADLDNAGFTEETIVPWLPLSPDAGAINVEIQREYPVSMLSLYRRLLAYRRATPALHSGAYVPLDAPEGCFAFLRVREDGEDRRLVVLNFTVDIVTVRVPVDASAGRIAVSTYMDPFRSGKPRVNLRDGFDLRADEGVIIEL